MNIIALCFINESRVRLTNDQDQDVATKYDLVLVMSMYN